MIFPYYHRLKFSQIWSSFVDVTWKFDRALLSRAEIFAKLKKQFCWSDLKICTASYITSWSCRKNKAVLLMIWKFKLPLLSRAEIFSEIKQFYWCALKISNAPIIAEAEIFSKIKQFCWSDLTISSYLNILAATIPPGRIFWKIRFFVNMTTWKFDLSLLWRLQFSQK